MKNLSEEKEKTILELNELFNKNVIFTGSFVLNYFQLIDRKIGDLDILTTKNELRKLYTLKYINILKFIEIYINDKGKININGIPIDFNVRKIERYYDFNVLGTQMKLSYPEDIIKAKQYYIDQKFEYASPHIDKHIDDLKVIKKNMPKFKRNLNIKRLLYGN